MLTMRTEAHRAAHQTDDWWVALCPDADRRSRRLLRDLGNEVVYPAGATVVEAGQRADRFVFIIHGEVDVEAGGEIIATLDGGEFFGEVAMLYAPPRLPESPAAMERTATVRTTTVTRTRELDRRELMTLMDASPQAATQISRRAIGRLATITGTVRSDTARVS